MQLLIVNLMQFTVQSSKILNSKGDTYSCLCLDTINFNLLPYHKPERVHKKALYSFVTVVWQGFQNQATKSSFTIIYFNLKLAKLSIK